MASCRDSGDLITMKAKVVRSISSSIIQTLGRFVTKFVSGLATARLYFQDVRGP